MAVESERAGETLKEASRTRFGTYKYKLGAWIGGIGAAVGAFFGAAPGLAVGGAGGAVVGASIGKGIEKGGEKRLEKINFKKPGEQEESKEE